MRWECRGCGERFWDADDATDHVQRDHREHETIHNRWLTRTHPHSTRQTGLDEVTADAE